MLCVRLCMSMTGVYDKCRKVTFHSLVNISCRHPGSMGAQQPSFTPVSPHLGA